MPYKMIQVGTGGWGNWWCRTHLPPNLQDGLIEVVAAVDVNSDALQNAREGLGLRADQCYTDIQRAFDENPADFCTVVVPPAFHESVVDVALAHGTNILSEKPIADSMAASVRIADKVASAGVKMGVTMSHRFRQDITTLRTAIRSGRFGDLDYLVCRFTCECRSYATWGKFRYEIADPLMIEGAVHHLDLLADMAASTPGALCRTLYAQTWQPRWGEFAGDAQALVTMQIEGGTRVMYEGAKTNAVGLNGWGEEYIRAECSEATLILSHGRIERHDYDRSRTHPRRREGRGIEVPLLQQPKWANAWLVEQFVRWLDGGEPMETNVQDNLQSVALIFAAIESSRTGQPIKVQEFLAGSRNHAANRVDRVAF
jgi:predicted dehydrogenase